MVDTAPRGNTERVQENLRAAFLRQDFYEAHQICKTLTFRLSKQNKFDELAEFLFGGSMQFFRLLIPQSGIDLARQFADTLEKGDLPVTDDKLQKISELLHEIPAKPDSERSIFLGSILGWAVKRNPEAKGIAPRALHSVVAKVYLEERNFPMALYYFVRALDVNSCVGILREVYDRRNDDQPSAEPSENNKELNEDLDQRLAGLAVLELLALRRHDLAKQLFVDYISGHENQGIRTKCYNFKILALISALLSVCSKTNRTDGEGFSRLQSFHAEFLELARFVHQPDVFGFLDAAVTVAFSDHLKAVMFRSLPSGREIGSPDEFSRIQTALSEVYSDSPRAEKLLATIGHHYLGVKPSGPLQGILAMFKKDGSSPESGSKAASVMHQDLDFD